MKPHEMKFQIDSFGGQIFDGYSFGGTWNGFMCPYFTFDQAQRIVDAYRLRGWEAWYEEKADQFVFTYSHNNLDERDIFPANEIDGRKFYPIGSSAWIWDEAENSQT